MHRLRFVALALVAMAAVLGVMSASAFAELEEFTVETPATTPLTKVTSTFETPSAFEGSVVSSELEAEQAPSSKKLGTLHIIFKATKCKNPLLGTASGESLGDSAGIVLVLGEYHVVNSGLVLLLISPVHIECLFSSGTVLLVVEGDLLGKLTQVNKTKFELEVKGSKGKQTNATEYENNSKEKVATKLETSSSLGTKAASSQNESANTVINTTKETELV